MKFAVSVAFLYTSISDKANAFFFHPNIFQQKKKEWKKFSKFSYKTGEGEERSHTVMRGLGQILYTERLRETIKCI